MEQILTVVPWPRTDARVWGITCPDHPQRGNPTPTDTILACAQAYAEACACGHPAHEGRTITTLDVPPFTGNLVTVTEGRMRVGRVRLAFFGNHDDAGLMEVGFIDGTTRLVPFERCAPASWPLPEGYDVIPHYPAAPDAHLSRG